MLTWGASALRAEEEDRRAQRHFVQQQRAGQQAHREAEGGGRGAGGGRTSGYACLVEAVPTRSRSCVRARRPARRGQAGAQKPPLHVHWRIAGDRTACSWFSIRIIHEASLRVESTYNTEVRSRRGQLSRKLGIRSFTQGYSVFALGAGVGKWGDRAIGIRSGGGY